jgi:hypothetical protein
MYRNSFIACILTLGCFIILIPSVGFAQSDKIKASMAALKAETAKLGAPKVGKAATFIRQDKSLQRTGRYDRQEARWRCHAFRKEGQGVRACGHDGEEGGW